MKRGAALCVAGVVAAAAASANSDVQPFAAQYEGRKKIALFTTTARARIELQHADPYLRYTMRTTVQWMLIERRFRDCAVMRIDAGRLWPLEYRHADESDAEHNVHTRFDWAQGKVSTLRGAAAMPLVVDIAWPTWDPMSFQVALMAAAPQRAAASVETHRVVERGALKQHQVEFSGAVSGTPLYRIISRKGDDELRLLLLPQQGWQPQRLTIDDVTIERTGSAAAEASLRVVPGQAPQCESAP